MSEQIVSKNKKAGFQYELFDRFVAGIVITGSEIKSIRQGKINFVDSFCVFIGDELFIRGLHIAEYSHGGYANHVPVHDRKLLLNKSELSRMQKKVKEKGFTIIPLACLLTEKGKAKIEIAVARGKKIFDKRESIKTKDSKRDTERAQRE
jgi:SsrA-binding protein